MGTEEAKSSRYLAEFVGTFLLVFTVGCNVIDGSKVWGVTSIACVLMVSIYAFASSSGANFNPAVSLALGISGKLAWMEVGIYCLVQVVAGIVAGMCYWLMFGKVFNLAPSAGFGWASAGAAEVFYTFMLCFVVLNCAACASTSGNQFYGLAIGFVVIAGGYGAGAISGGAFNPAVALGIDISSTGIGFGWGLAYVGYELLGAALAGLAFKVVRPEEFPSHGQPQPRRPDQYGMLQKLVSEFLGTFMLVLTVGLNVLGRSPAGAWSIAASLMCMIFSLGGVSGAHFNPAVTLAILLAGRGKTTPTEAGMYVGVQCLAGIAAGITFAGMHHWSFISLGPSSPYGWGACGAAEIVFTFVLCFVVLCVATRRDAGLTQYFGLAIGSCVTVGGIAIGGISGGSLNPAVSLGIASGRPLQNGWSFCFYTIFELLGGGLAALVFYVVYPSEYRHKGLPGHM